MESGIRDIFACKSGILRFGIRNPSSTDKVRNPASRNPESTVLNAESKTTLDFLTWDEITISVSGRLHAITTPEVVI